jgi:hypothetical protein
VAITEDLLVRLRVQGQQQFATAMGEQGRTVAGLAGGYAVPVGVTEEILIRLRKNVANETMSPVRARATPTR